MTLDKGVKVLMTFGFMGVVGILPLQLQTKENAVSRLPASIIGRSKTLDLPKDTASLQAGSKVSLFLSQKCLHTARGNQFLRSHLSKGVRLSKNDWQTVTIELEKDVSRDQLDKTLKNETCLFEIHYPARGQ